MRLRLQAVFAANAANRSTPKTPPDPRVFKRLYRIANSSLSYGHQFEISKSNISVRVEGNLREFVRIGVVRHEKRVFVSDMLAEQGDCLVKKSTTAMVSLLLLGTSAQAQQMPDADQLKAKIATIQAKYQPRIDALKAEGDDVTKDLPSKEEAAIGFSIENRRQRRLLLYPRPTSARLSTECRGNF